MQNRLYVSHLARDVFASALQQSFEPYRYVADVQSVASAKEGCAFVIMATDEVARTALVGLNGASLHGTVIRIEVARDVARVESGGKS